MWISPDNGGLHYDSYDLNGNRFDHQELNFFQSANEWVHVTWLKDGNEYRLYRNGILIHTDSAPNQVYMNANTDYKFGRVNNPLGFEGILDDISIWDHALTQTEM